jgi:putative membrane protein
LKLSLNLLWVLVAAYVALVLLSTVVLFPISIPLVVLLSVSFALIHGALRYRWSGIVTFIVIALVVSNILENTSILTGFPFGHYYYTDALGPKLFLVPLLIGPAYVATGYLAWVLSTIHVGDVRADSSALSVFAVPLIASFLMVAWDLCMDPARSTVQRWWIWEQGGGYFGVPLTNYLGWFLTVYVFFQLFAVYLRFRGPGRREILPLPRSYFAQAVVMYAVLGLTYLVVYLVGSNNTTITDAAGVVWHSRSISESAAIVSLYTMVFVAVLSTLKLIQGQTEVNGLPR